MGNMKHQRPKDLSEVALISERMDQFQEKLTNICRSGLMYDHFEPNSFNWIISTFAIDFCLPHLSVKISLWWKGSVC